MARHRQRARDRKQRKNAEDHDGEQHLHRENVPGSLDHSSAGVEEVEAAIVAGADGEPIDGDFDVDDDASVSEKELAAVDAEKPLKKGPLGSRFIAFLRACWAELQRVQWPDRRQVGQATAVVLGFVVVAGAFLGLADVVAQKLVDYIL